MRPQSASRSRYPASSPSPSNHLAGEHSARPGLASFAVRLPPIPPSRAPPSPRKGAPVRSPHRSKSIPPRSRNRRVVRIERLGARRNEPHRHHRAHSECAALGRCREISSTDPVVDGPGSVTSPPYSSSRYLPHPDVGVTTVHDVTSPPRSTQHRHHPGVRRRARRPAYALAHFGNRRRCRQRHRHARHRPMANTTVGIVSSATGVAPSPCPVVVSAGQNTAYSTITTVSVTSAVTAVFSRNLMAWPARPPGPSLVNPQTPGALQSLTISPQPGHARRKRHRSHHPHLRRRQSRIDGRTQIQHPRSLLRAPHYQRARGSPPQLPHRRLHDRHRNRHHHRDRHRLRRPRPRPLPSRPSEIISEPRNLLRGHMSHSCPLSADRNLRVMNERGRCGGRTRRRVELHPFDKMYPTALSKATLGDTVAQTARLSILAI